MGNFQWFLLTKLAFGGGLNMLNPLSEVPFALVMSCRKLKIDEETAIDIALTFKEEFGYFPVNLEDALEVLE